MILVTGGTGLVGSHLLYKLVKQNQPVRAIVRNKSRIDFVKNVFSYYSEEADRLISKIDWVVGDMLDLFSLNEAFRGVSKVFHCAAIVSIGGNSKQELIDANVTGTENIVNLCVEHKVEKLCHVSSIASLGGSINGDIITENTKWRPLKHHYGYATSKYE